MISEIIMLRLFSIVEISIEEVALKLACGAKYKNGTPPIVLLRCRSMQDAHVNMLTHNRRRASRYLKWTKASYIRDSIQFVLNITDCFYSNIQIHGNIINEMRIVRNHVAHRSTSTKNEYLNLLRSRYGGNPNLTLGAFLISKTRNPISNIEYYIRAAKIVLNDITKG
ncbi:hypothetical protein [Mucilaginibacter gotjawali]|uniref:Uncharacterized protein n=2 Tax=Mucilaginibacter gotjawali TaxID=1550579 RepID=A0A839SK88_9SPHI|nr:hypothetical protein [Mucilaginibacter gotjawali]MBB3058296.1 hypothetical protein [Mucilaginibacter gotjawali]BAU55585.1 hypothetical protein MgSA37_03775 [Mucilaginibacter gotjawali]